MVQRAKEKESSSRNSSAGLDKVDTSLWDEQESQEEVSLDRVDTSLWEVEEPEPESKDKPESESEESDPVEAQISAVEQDENVGLLGNFSRSFSKGIRYFSTLGGAGLQLVGSPDAPGELFDRPLAAVQDMGERLEKWSTERQQEVIQQQDPEYRRRLAKDFLEQGEEPREDNILDIQMGAVEKDFLPPGSRTVEKGKEISLGEAATDPVAITGKTMESLFPSLVGMVSGYKYTQFLQKSLGLSSQASGVIGMGLGESQLYAASSAHEVYNAVSNAPVEQLADSPEYQKLLQTVPGKTEEEIALNAREELAGELAWKSAAKTGALVWAMHVPIGSYVGKLIGGETTEVVSRSAFKTTFLSSVAEYPKSAGSKYFSNMAAVKSYDPERDPMEGVSEAGVAGSVTVAPMGAVTGISMNMLGRRGSAEPPTPRELGGVEVSAQNIKDALEDQELFTAWKDRLVEVSGKQLSDQDFVTILDAELERFEAASAQDAEKKGVTNRKDVGKAFRKFRWPRSKKTAEELDAEGRDSRYALTNAQQRVEGDLGLASDHILAQSQLDTYNRLRQMPEPVFEKMEREAEAEEVTTEKPKKKKVKTVEEVTTEETRETVNESLDKIRPKPETAEEEVTQARDEEYGQDVELKKTDEGYEIATTEDWSGITRTKKVSSGTGGVYLDGYILNSYGEFVPAGEIVQAGTGTTDLAKTPFKPTGDTKAEVLNLVAQIEFARAQGNMSKVEVLEAQLADIAAGRKAAAQSEAKSKRTQEGQPEGDIFTKQGKPFKSQAGAKSRRTRAGLVETHDIVEVEGGYALRPVEQAQPENVADTAEVESENPERVFEDLEVLLEEQAKANAGESEMTLAELDPIIESVQDDVIRYIEELDPTLRSAFISNNMELTDTETGQLVDLLNKEAGEGINVSENTAKNQLIRKMVGKPQITAESLENKGKEPVQEEDEAVTATPTMFDSDAESVSVLKRAYESKGPDQIRGNPDTMLGYFINQLNSWIHGIGDADVGRIRESLEQVRAEQQEFYPYFGSQARLNEFIEAVDGAIELAERANELKSKGSNPNILRSSFGMEAFYPAAVAIISRINNWKGKMNARSALNRLKKNVSAADMEYLRIDEILNQAAREGRKISKEEILEKMAKLPEVEVEIRSTERTEADRVLTLLNRAREAFREAPHRLNTDKYNSVRARAAKVYNITEQQVDDYVSGDLDPFDFLDIAKPNIGVETAYDQYSFYRRLPPTDDYIKGANPPYEYDEILISLPEYGPKQGDMYHSAFGKSVAFFGRMARNQDRFVVEEIQSELATMKAKGRPDIPAPYKTKAWPNLVASALIKRAKSLGYDTIYMPTYEWVNQRWEGHLPKSVKPVYDKIFPEAMEELGAKRLADESVEDARLFGDSSTTRLIENRIANAYDRIKQLKRLFKSPFRLARRLDTELESLDEDNIKLIKDPQMWDSTLVSEVRQGNISWTGLAKMAGEINRVRPYTAAQGDNIYAAVAAGSDLEVLGLSLDRENAVGATGAAMREMDDAIEDTSGVTEAELYDFILSYVARTSEPLDIPFQRYQLPKEDPAPQSVGTTLNMGFDPTNVVRLAKRATGKTQKRRGRPDPVAKMYEDTRKESEKAFKSQSKEVQNILKTKLVDVTSPMKSMITETFGEKKSNQMINRIILAKGHSVRASMFLNRAMKDIYGRVGKKNREILNEIIFSARIIQIARYKGNVTDFKGRTGQQHINFLNNIEEVYGISEGEALDLFRRASIYFDKTLALLDVLREDGLISQEEYNELKTFKWTRTEALKNIDPDVKRGALSPGQSVAQRRQGASTKESGIEELELGSELDTPNIDMEYVLADWTQRVMKRSALAKMNKSLWDLASSEQRNELVRPAAGKSRPKNWSTAEMLVRGEKKKVYIHPEFARYWTMEMSEISPMFANVARVVSGSFVLRPMATGVRLGFIPLNIARDMVLQQYSAKYMDESGDWKPTWNKWMPIGTAQQLFEMGRVVPAALFRTKRYQRFAESGGSMLFMSVQGKPFQAADIKTRFGRGPAAKMARAGHKMDQVMDVLSYLNTTSEIITRLSLVEKSLERIAKREGVSKEQARNNQDMYEEAAAISRDYLDFGQAGSMVKAIDTVRPYTNAAFQSGRSMLKSWKRDWKHAALQSAQVAGIGALLSFGRAGYMKEEEDGITRSIERDISTRDLARNFITFPFGREFYFTDEYGNRHRPYVKIPVDGLLIPPKILGEVSASMMAGEEIRGDVISEGMKAAMEPYGVSGGIGVPSLDAYFTMAHNLDTFFGGKVWPYEEYMEAGKRVTKDTPQFFRDMSEFMNTMPGVDIPPKQFYEAARGIGAGGTWFTTYFGQAYDHFRDVPESDRELIFWEAIADHPTTGGMINYTRPDVAAYEDIEEWETDAVTKRMEKKLHVMREAKRIREIANGEIKGQGGPIQKRKELSDYIEKKAEDEDERKRLYEVLEFQTEMPSTPRFSQWQRIAGKSPETKAKYIKQMMRDAGPVEKDKIWDEARMFPYVDSEAVWREYDRLTEKESGQ